MAIQLHDFERLHSDVRGHDDDRSALRMFHDHESSQSCDRAPEKIDREVRDPNPFLSEERAELLLETAPAVEQLSQSNLPPVLLLSTSLVFVLAATWRLAIVSGSHMWVSPPRRQ